LAIPLQESGETNSGMQWPHFCLFSATIPDIIVTHALFPPLSFSFLLIEE
jgi:hypothetical protein